MNYPRRDGLSLILAASAAIVLIVIYAVLTATR